MVITCCEKCEKPIMNTIPTCWCWLEDRLEEGCLEIFKEDSYSKSISSRLIKHLKDEMAKGNQSQSCGKRPLDSLLTNHT